MITKIDEKQWREHRQRLADLMNRIGELFREITKEIKWTGYMKKEEE